MKRNIILVLTAIFAACNNPKSEEKQKQSIAEEKAVAKPANEVSLKDDQLNAVYQQYLLLSNALVNSNLSMAKETAMALELGAKNLRGSAKLENLAAKIIVTNNLETQRILFSDLSNEMIAKVKTAGLKSGEIYVEYCPMALNDKGAAWLSNQKEIRNPYYGNEMLDCGEIKETVR